MEDMDDGLHEAINYLKINCPNKIVKFYIILLGLLRKTFREGKRFKAEGLRSRP